MKNSKLILLFLSLLICFNAISQNYIRIKNRNKSTYLHNERGTLELGAAPMTWWSAQWVLEKVPNQQNFVRIKNRNTGQFIHCERGTLEVGAAPIAWWSAMWSIEPVTGGTFSRIKNRNTGKYIHCEQGKLEAGAIQNTWWSAMWLMEGVGSGPAAPPLLRNEYLASDQVNAIIIQKKSPVLSKKVLKTVRNIPPNLQGRERGLDPQNEFNHTQGLTMLPDGSLAISYTQHINKAIQYPASYYDNNSSYLIIGNKNIFNINKVPARNFVEISGLASIDNIIAATWVGSVHFYNAEPTTGSISEIEHLTLPFSRGFVGFSEFKNNYYVVTTGDEGDIDFYKRKNLKNDGQNYVVSGVNAPWEYLASLKNTISSDTKVGAISLFSSGDKLYLGVMHYQDVFELSLPQNYISIYDVSAANGTGTLVKKWEVPLGTTSEGYKSPNFRWGGTMRVAQGKLEVYSIAYDFDKLNDSINLSMYTW